MNWLVVGLKLLGAVVAIQVVRARPPAAVRTVLVWGAFGLLGLYSAGNVVQLVVMVLSDPGGIAVPWLAYVVFFLTTAVGFGVLAVSYSRCTHARRSHAVLGILGAPPVFGALLVGTPAALSAMGLLPSL